MSYAALFYTAVVHNSCSADAGACHHAFQDAVLLYVQLTCRVASLCKLLRHGLLLHLNNNTFSHVALLMLQRSCSSVANTIFSGKSTFVYICIFIFLYSYFVFRISSKPFLFNVLGAWYSCVARAQMVAVLNYLAWFSKGKSRSEIGNLEGKNKFLYRELSAVVRRHICLGRRSCRYVMQDSVRKTMCVQESSTVTQLVSACVYKGDLNINP